MCSEIYIPELIRLVILRVFQNLAPQRAWIPNSLTAEGCGAVLNDEAPFLITSEVFNDLWDWATTSDELPLLHELVSVCFIQKLSVESSLSFSRLCSIDLLLLVPLLLLQCQNQMVIYNQPWED